MNRQWLAASVAIVMIGFVVGASADEVIIKTIDPDKPTVAQTQPDQAARPVDPAAPTPPATTPLMGIAGDQIMSYAFTNAKITDEQKARLKDVLDRLSAEAAQDRAKTAEITAKYMAALKAARDAGLKNMMDSPECRDLQGQLNTLWKQNYAATEDRRKELLAAMQGVVSDDQYRAVLAVVEQHSADPRLKNRGLARGWMASSYPGVAISGEQHDRIVEKVAPIQEKFGQQFAELQRSQGEKMREYMTKDPKAAWQRVQTEFAPKFEELRTALSKALNEAIEAELTDEQKRQVAGGRAEAWKKSIQTWVEATAKAFEPVKLTAEQKEKVKDLAEAAGEAMLKTDMYDQAGRTALAEQLREDIKRLLTDEQRRLVR